jgi:mono/diheme cytochrome c family protein
MHSPPAIRSVGSALLLAGTLLAGCGGSSTAIVHPTTPAGGPPDAAHLFQAACAACHGPAGAGGISGVSLKELATSDRPAIADAIRHGIGAMPASSAGMSDDEINALAEYVVGLR